MLKQMAVAFIAVALAVGCVTTSTTAPVRLDASSGGAAEASYKTMMKGRSESSRQQLALAVLVLNMEGVQSAGELFNDPALRSPSVARIRNRIAGMTAEQIIDLAARSKSIRIEAARQ